MNEDRIKKYLLDILEDLYNNKISKEVVIDKLNQNGELIEQVVEKGVSFYISDCFWTIKHLLEEDITNNEIKYFIDCFKNKIKYNLEEKNEVILKEYQQKIKVKCKLQFIE